MDFGLQREAILFPEQWQLNMRRSLRKTVGSNRTRINAQLIHANWLRSKLPTSSSYTSYHACIKFDGQRLAGVVERGCRSMAPGDFTGEDAEEGRFGTAARECCAVTEVGLPSKARDVGSPAGSELRIDSVSIISSSASVANQNQTRCCYPRREGVPLA